VRESVTFVLRYFFEWGGGCLWPGNDAAHRAFDVGPYDLAVPCPLPLGAATLDRCRRLAAWHDLSLDPDYPPDPGPWDQAERDRFNEAAAALLGEIRTELGRDFSVVDEQIGR
jgi:hypothetical protein